MRIHTPLIKTGKYRSPNKNLKQLVSHHKDWLHLKLLVSTKATVLLSTTLDKEQNYHLLLTTVIQFKSLKWPIKPMNFNCNFYNLIPFDISKKKNPI